MIDSKWVLTWFFWFFVAYSIIWLIVLGIVVENLNA